MELGELWIQSSNTSCGYGSITIVEPVGIKFLTSQLQSIQGSIHSSKRVNDTHILQGYFNASFVLTIPFYTTPVTFNELPKNEDLGIIIPPCVLKIDGSNQVIFSTSMSQQPDNHLVAVAITVAPDSTMRYDCMIIGVVAILLFSLKLYKKREYS